MSFKSDTINHQESDLLLIHNQFLTVIYPSCSYGLLQSGKYANRNQYKVQLHNTQDLASEDEL